MITLLLHLLGLLPFLCGGHRQLALENLALRHQLAVYKRTVARPKLQETGPILHQIQPRNLGNQGFGDSTPEPLVLQRPGRS